MIGADRHEEGKRSRLWQGMARCLPLRAQLRIDRYSENTDEGNTELLSNGGDTSWDGGGTSRRGFSFPMAMGWDILLVDGSDIIWAYA